LLYEDGKKYKYALSGEFLDRANWLSDRIKNGNAYELFKIADKLFSECRNSQNEELIQEALNFSLSAVNRLKGDPWSRSRMYRKVGEFYISINDFRNAITYFESALKDDPNVGLKKKLQTLKNQTTSK
jgi:hypothetical protein